MADLAPEECDSGDKSGPHRDEDGFQRIFPDVFFATVPEATGALPGLIAYRRPLRSGTLTHGHRPLLQIINHVPRGSTNLIGNPSGLCFYLLELSRDHGSQIIESRVQFLARNAELPLQSAQ